MNDKNNFDFISGKLLNFMMVDGKKSVAEKILNTSLSKANEKLNLQKDSMVLVKAVLNVSPDIEIKTKKIGTNVYQVPRALTEDKKINLGIKFILQACKARKEYTMVDKLTSELIDAYNNKGLAIKKKDEIHKLAEINKSFSHFSF
jgi:small subunit ribosomal protein S7